MSGRGTPNPFGRRGQRARRRGFGIDPSFPLDEGRLKGVLDNWAVEQNARFGGGLPQNIEAGRNFAAASMEADPELTAPGTGLRAQLLSSAEEAIKHGLGTAPAQPLHDLANQWKAAGGAGGIGAVPAPFDYQQVMQAMKPHMGTLGGIQDLHAMGLGSTAAAYTGVEERMRDVRGAQAAYLQSGVEKGVNRVDPGLLAAAGGPAPGTIDVGAFQKAMDSAAGGPSTLRSMSIMEKMLDTLQASLRVEGTMADSLKDHVTVAAAGGGGGGGAGAGTSGLAGALFGAGGGALRGMLGKLGEAGPEGMIAEAVFKAMDLVGVTRAREYEPIRQLGLLPGMSQQGDINQIALGQTNAFGIPGRAGGAATVPFFHEMGGQTENDLRYNLQYAATEAGLGREAGQQVAMGLGRYGVGFGETRPGQAAGDILETAKVAMGPGRAAGLTTEGATEVTGIMRGQAGMGMGETIQRFEELIDVSQRLGVGAKNLSEAFKQMLEAGFDPRQINVRDLGIAQGLLGPGTNVGGMMGMVGQMNPIDKYAMMATLQILPGGTGPGSVEAGLKAESDPLTILQGMSKFTQQSGGMGGGFQGFQMWQGVMQSVFKGDVLGAAGLNQEQQAKLYESMSSGRFDKETRGFEQRVSREYQKELEDPHKFLKDATTQMGQGSDAFQKAVDNFTTSVNQFASTGGDISAALKFLGHTDRDVEGTPALFGGGGAGDGAGPAPTHSGTMPRQGQLRPPRQHTPAPSYLGVIPDPEPLSAAQAALPEVTSHDRPATSYVATPSLGPASVVGTLVPALGAELGSTFNSPVVRTALSQALSPAIQGATGGASGMGGGGTGPRVPGAQVAGLADLPARASGNWQQALDMYNAGPGARPTAGDSGGQILSAAADLDLTLSGTLTVVDQSGQKVGTAQINRQGHHAHVNARPAAGHRTSGQAATRSGPIPS